METDKINVEKEKIIIQLSMLDSKTRDFEQQIMAIDQELQELKLLQNDLERFSKEGKKEILMPLSRNILVKGNVIDSENVLVNVGGGILLRKTLDEAKEMSENDEKKISRMKEKLLDEIDNIVNHMISLEAKIREA